MLLQRRVDALNPYPNIAYQTGLVMGANKRFGPFMNSIAYIVKVLDLLGPRNSFGSNILVIRKTESMPKYLKAHTISPWVMDWDISSSGYVKSHMCDSKCCGEFHRERESNFFFWFRRQWESNLFSLKNVVSSYL